MSIVIDDVISNVVDCDRLFIFLDYDGTLTPIVKNPKDAILSEKMYRILHQLSTKSPKKVIVSIVTGRDIPSITEFIPNLDNLYFAGNHGIEILPPRNEQMPWIENNINILSPRSTTSISQISHDHEKESKTSKHHNSRNNSIDLNTSVHSHTRKDKEKRGKSHTNTKNKEKKNSINKNGKNGKHLKHSNSMDSYFGNDYDFNGKQSSSSSGSNSSDFNGHSIIPQYFDSRNDESDDLVSDMYSQLYGTRHHSYNSSNRPSYYYQPSAKYNRKKYQQRRYYQNYDGDSDDTAHSPLFGANSVIGSRYIPDVKHLSPHSATMTTPTTTTSSTITSTTTIAKNPISPHGSKNKKYQTYNSQRNKSLNNETDEYNSSCVFCNNSNGSITISNAICGFDDFDFNFDAIATTTKNKTKTKNTNTNKKNNNRISTETIQSQSVPPPGNLPNKKHCSEHLSKRKKIVKNNDFANLCSKHAVILYNAKRSLSQSESLSTTTTTTLTATNNNNNNNNNQQVIPEISINKGLSTSNIISNMIGTTNTTTKTTDANVILNKVDSQSTQEQCKNKRIKKIFAPRESVEKLESALNELRGIYKVETSFKGSLIEWKVFSLAVHYRNIVDTMDIGKIDEILAKLARKYQLYRGYGKKVFELRTVDNWHKGKAIQWLSFHCFLNKNILAYKHNKMMQFIDDNSNVISTSRSVGPTDFRCHRNPNRSITSSQSPRNNISSTYTVPNISDKPSKNSSVSSVIGGTLSNHTSRRCSSSRSRYSRTRQRNRRYRIPKINILYIGDDLTDETAFEALIDMQATSEKFCGNFGNKKDIGNGNVPINCDNRIRAAVKMKNMNSNDDRLSDMSGMTKYTVGGLGTRTQEEKCDNVGPVRTLSRTPATQSHAFGENTTFIDTSVCQYVEITSYSILVCETEQETKAQFRLNNVSQVQSFLSKLVEKI